MGRSTMLLLIVVVLLLTFGCGTPSKCEGDRCTPDGCWGHLDYRYVECSNDANDDLPWCRDCPPEVCGDVYESGDLLPDVEDTK